MTLPEAVARELIAHAREMAPLECCGLLIGEGATIHEAARARNIADAPDRRYLLDPRDHLKAIRDARASGRHVLGAYHSHPRSDATPSATDTAEAFGDFLFLIVGLGTQPPALMAWTLVAGNFVAVPLVRVP